MEMLSNVPQKLLSLCSSAVNKKYSPAMKNHYFPQLRTASGYFKVQWGLEGNKDNAKMLLMAEY